MNINASIKRQFKFSKKNNVIVTLKQIKLKSTLLLKQLIPLETIYQHSMYESKMVQSDESITEHFPPF